MKNTVITLGSFAVRSATGTIDCSATEEKFASLLRNFVAERETEDTEIELAVEATFDEYVGVRLNTDFLTSAAATRLNAQNDNFKTMKDKVAAFIKENSCKKDEEGKPLDATKRYHVAKGAGGGVGRWTDLLAAQATASAKEA